MILAFNKPYGVLSQFTQEAPHHRTLAEFGFPAGVYPVGRLDADSEGLLLLSDEKALVDRLLNPSNRHPRTYWSQVEGVPSATDLLPLERGGLSIQGYRTLPCRVRPMLGEPDVPPRNPPVRYRAAIPTSWVFPRSGSCASGSGGSPCPAWNPARGRSWTPVNEGSSCRNIGLIRGRRSLYMSFRIRISYLDLFT